MLIFRLRFGQSLCAIHLDRHATTLASRFDATVVIDGAALQDMFASCVSSSDPLPAVCSPTQWLPLHVVRTTDAAAAAVGASDAEQQQRWHSDRLYVSRALPLLHTLSNRRKNALYYAMCLRAATSRAAADVVPCDRLRASSSSTMASTEAADDESVVSSTSFAGASTADDELHRLAMDCGANLQVRHFR